MAEPAALENPLAQRNDEIRSFAGFAGIDALIGNDDRAAGRERFCNSRHRIRRDGEAIQCFSRTVRHRQWLDLGRARALPPALGALLLATPLRLPASRGK